MTSKDGRDELDTIGQRTTQYRLTWRRYMLRPSPNHGTLRLPNDDDDDDDRKRKLNVGPTS